MILAVDEVCIDPEEMLKIKEGTPDEGTIGLLETLNENMKIARQCAKLQSQFTQLGLIGEVFYIVESDHGTTELHPRIFKVPNDFIDETFLVLDKMLSDHGSEAYMNAFDKMKYD